MNTLNRIKSLPETQSHIILNSIVEGVFTVDQDLRITYFNKAAEKITGVRVENALGEFCFEVFKSNLCEVSCPIKTAILTGCDSINQKVNILRFDGKEIPISINASALKDEVGKIIGGVETFRDLSTIVALRKEIEKGYTFEDIVSKNHKILELFNILPNISESEATVLIQGPSGSGKELFARAIHNLSFRKNGPFIAINCGALPDNLLESELFGYYKGAFTDAQKDKPGRFELAKGGTIFLDEVESLSPATQVKLLRVLQEKEFEPLGATSSVKTNVRIISATKDNLLDLVSQNKFRDDLYFRLNIVKIELPSLKERKDDIPYLINHFIELFNYKMEKMISSVSNEVLEFLMNYSFPGNIRELENIIEHAFVMCQNEVIEFEDLPNDLINMSTSEIQSKKNLIQPIEKSECDLIFSTLKKHDWNKIEVAKELKLHRSTLWRKMRKYGLLQ
ncbi:MAG: sigma 54-interacting transcriptional regulator [Bacteroidetes bacterium]|nr:sigma 54-interacting transcriptional regulator [Bacteroidota bacterium]MBU1113956.1 sigma 54-interacting transcriptional regulator [Bacteroidota bacterium]MBU1800107.1 sigma 54-interacting transcriptional regulator [Bacteroidota bacterium]